MKKSEALNILGLHDGATPEEIKQAHRTKIRENHPDRFSDPEKKRAAEEKTKLINEARDVLNSGKWDPESGPRNAGYNPYASSYGRPQHAAGQDADPFAGMPFDFVWTSWDNVGTQSQGAHRGYRTEWDAYDPRDPFGTGFQNADPFASVFTREPQKTPEEEVAEAKADMNQVLVSFAVKLAVLAVCALVGGLAVGMFIYVIATLLFAIAREASGCSSFLIIPFLFVFGPMIAVLMPGLGSQIGGGLLVFFGISLAYDIGVIRRTVSTWRTASEKAKVSR
ncbi:MAG: DnaJ domain-containing protein [Denitrobacterium sp.]|jgi:hypothetical protein|nr:DnaJ domain-containing protein [Denitrobacterium sp.]MCI1479431.1 DnaJ domain-containing protein [Eggerthellaceae bacterium]